MRRQEEEKQRQATTRREQEEQARAEELRTRIATLTEMAKNQTTNGMPAEEAPPNAETIATPPDKTVPVTVPAEAPATPINDIAARINQEKQQQEEARRALELERVRRENEEAEEERIRVQTSPASNPKSIIDGLKTEDGLMPPLRTLKSDLARAIKNQKVSPDDLRRTDQRKFPWLNQNDAQQQ
jgi:hypothetical protein